MGGSTMSSEFEPREYSPEELRKIYAKFEKEFTCEKLIEYIEDDDVKFPIEDVLAKAEEIVRKWNRS
jgi:hypothetical protein